MRLVKIRGRLPLQRCTGSKYRISVLLDFESRSEKETVYRKAGLEPGTGARVLSAMYLDLDDNLMQETYVTLQGRHADGRKFELEVPTTRRWRGALEAARAYLESRKTIYGY